MRTTGVDVSGADDGTDVVDTFPSQIYACIHRKHPVDDHIALHQERLLNRELCKSVDKSDTM